MRNTIEIRRRCLQVLLILSIARVGLADDRSPQACAECHSDIVKQWQCSAHARAWTNPKLRSVVESNDDSPCLKCHASVPLLEQAADEPAKLRDNCRVLGVDCNTCHALGCDYAGPYDSWGPHGMKQENCRLRSSAFCGTCHEVEFEEYNELYVPSAQSGTPSGCSDCHMPAYRDRLTQKSLLSLMHPKRIVRDHSFPVWTERVLRDAIRLDRLTAKSEARGEFKVSFQLRNVGAGHRIPTGGFGHRELHVQVELIDSDGLVIAKADQKILPDDEQSLAPGKAIPFVLCLDAAAGRASARIRVLVERVDQDRSLRAVLLDHKENIETRDPGPRPSDG